MISGKIILWLACFIGHSMGSDLLASKQASPSSAYSSTSYTASVFENLPAGTFVVDMSISSAAGTFYSIAPIEDARSANIFQINTTTGVIKTSQTLDRETMPVHKLLVTAVYLIGSATASATASVTISVLDDNDFTPAFTQAVYATSVAENLPANSFVAAVFATDADDGNNAIVRYSIELCLPALDFRIDHSNGQVVTLRPLDRETIAEYNITLMARDSAMPVNKQLSSTCLLKVSVQDVNDHSPALPAVYNVSLKENALASAAAATLYILTVYAADPDSGPNGNVTYWLVSGNEANRFRLDPISGNLSLVAPLDYETSRGYVLRLQASDAGSPPRISTSSVLVTVLDVNDETPTFEQSSYSFSVPETQIIGQKFLLVRAVDHDSGLNGLVRYRLLHNGSLPGTVQFPFVVSDDGWLSAIVSLDREQVGFYYFSVAAFDSGQPPRSGTASVTITVIDANDNSPNFTQSVYTSVIAETAPIGSVILTVLATDPDLGENGAVVYSLAAGPDSPDGVFAISASAKAGVVTLAGTVSATVKPEYSLSLRGCDMGQPPRCSTAQLRVSVTPENRAAPIFSAPPGGYRFQVLENATSGRLVGQVVARDADSGFNGLVRYSLLAGGAAGPFVMDSESGALTVARDGALDRESQAVYYLTAVASDSGNPSKSATTDIQVDVADVNDVTPMFPRGDSSVSVNISESAPIGYPVARLVATDADAGLNGQVSYFLANDSGDGHLSDFSINAASGLVTVAKALDRESRPYYTLYVVAKDAGWPPLSSSGTIRVRLIDVNDSPPRWPDATNSFNLAENSPPGSVIGNLVATDADEGDNARLLFRLLSVTASDGSNFGVEAFSLTQLNATSAALLANRTFDYESSSPPFPKWLRLSIRASSGPLFADTVILVNITDVNDVPPMLPDTVAYLIKWDLLARIDPLGTITVLDPDTVNNFSFAIVAGNEAGAILIHPVTGLVSVDQRLNTNVNLNFSVTIRVSDGLHSSQGQLSLLSRYLSADVIANSVTLLVNQSDSVCYRSVQNGISEGIGSCLATILPVVRSTLAGLLSLPIDWILPLDSAIVNNNSQITASVNWTVFNLTLAVANDSNFLMAYDRDVLQQTIALYADQLAMGSAVSISLASDATGGSFCAAEPCGSFRVCTDLTAIAGPANQVEPLSGPGLLLRRHPTRPYIACRCPPGYSGRIRPWDCDLEADACHRPTGIGGSPACPAGSECVRLEAGRYYCRNLSTADGYSGGIALRFSGDDYSAYGGFRSRHRLSLELSFATVNADGLLLWIGRIGESPAVGEGALSDFLRIDLLGGQVLISYSLGGRPASRWLRKLGSFAAGQPERLRLRLLNGALMAFDLAADYCGRGGSAFDQDLATRLARSAASQANASLCAVAMATPAPLPAAACSDRDCQPTMLDLNSPLFVGGLPATRSARMWPTNATSLQGYVYGVVVDGTPLDLSKPMRMLPTVSMVTSGSALLPTASCRLASNCPPLSPESGQDVFTLSSADSLVYRFSSGLMLQWPLRFGLHFRLPEQLLESAVEQQLMRLALQSGRSVALLMTRAGFLAVETAPSSSMDTWTAQRLTLRQVAGLQDGSWHRVDVSLDPVSHNVRLSVDSGLRWNATLAVSSSSSAVNNWRFDSVEVVRESVSSFVSGCVGGLRLEPAGVLSGPAAGAASPGCSAGCNPAACQSSGGRCLPSGGCQPCPAGYGGAACDKRLCLTANPCSDGAVCFDKLASDGGGGIACGCSTGSGASGSLCEDYEVTSCPNAYWWKPAGSSVCSPCSCGSWADGFNLACNSSTGSCLCQPGYYSTGSACLTCDCYSIGSLGNGCQQQQQSPGSSNAKCNCLPGVLGNRCDRCESPYAEVTAAGCSMRYGVCPRTYSLGIWWPSTLHGEVAKVPCPSGYEGLASRLCLTELGDSSTLWSGDIAENCTRRQLEQLALFARAGIDADASPSVAVAIVDAVVGAIVSSRSNGTAAIEVLYRRDVLLSCSLLNRVMQHELSLVSGPYSGGSFLLNLASLGGSSTFQSNLLTALERLLRPDTVRAWRSGQNSGEFNCTAASLFAQLERYSVAMATVAKLDGLTAGNDLTDKQGISVCSASSSVSSAENSTNPVSAVKSIDCGPSLSRVSVSIELLNSSSEAAFSTSVLVWLGNHSSLIQNTTHSSESVVTTSPVVAVGVSVWTAAENRSWLVAQPEISVVIRFAGSSNSNATLNHRCAFWHPVLNLWSTDGCNSTGNFTCRCNHLSLFAIVGDAITTPIVKPFNPPTGSYTLLGLACLLHLYHAAAALPVARRCQSQTYWTRCHASLIACLALLSQAALLTQVARALLCRFGSAAIVYLSQCQLLWLCLCSWHSCRLVRHGPRADLCGLAASRFVAFLVPAGSTAFTLALAGDAIGSLAPFCWVSPVGSLPVSVYLPYGLLCIVCVGTAAAAGAILPVMRRRTASNNSTCCSASNGCHETNANVANVGAIVVKGILKGGAHSNNARGVHSDEPVAHSNQAVCLSNGRNLQTVESDSHVLTNQSEFVESIITSLPVAMTTCASRSALSSAGWCLAYAGASGYSANLYMAAAGLWLAEAVLAVLLEQAVEPVGRSLWRHLVQHRRLPKFDAKLAGVNSALVGGASRHPVASSVPPLSLAIPTSLPTLQPLTPTAATVHFAPSCNPASNLASSHSSDDVNDSTSESSSVSLEMPPPHLLQQLEHQAATSGSSPATGTRVSSAFASLISSRGSSTLPLTASAGYIDVVCQPPRPPPRPLKSPAYRRQLLDAVDGAFCYDRPMTDLSLSGEASSIGGGGSSFEAPYEYLPVLFPEETSV